MPEGLIDATALLVERLELVSIPLSWAQDVAGVEKVVVVVVEKVVVVVVVVEKVVVMVVKMVGEAVVERVERCGECGEEERVGVEMVTLRQQGGG